MPRTSVSLGLVSVLALLTACDSSGGIVGHWEPMDLANPMTLEFRADSTFSINTGEFTGEGNYTLENDRVLVLNPTGTLASVIPGGFDGTVVRDSLNLCAPSGACTDFHKVP